MARRKTQTKKYWLSTFSVEDEDVEYLVNVLLESEMPLTSDEMALLMMRYRARQEERHLQRRAQKAGKVYRPEDSYEEGDGLVFVHLENIVGEVTAIREGTNPEAGAFSVITVEFEEGGIQEFASSLETEHDLNGIDRDTVDDDEEQRTPEELFIEFGGHVSSLIEARLVEHPDLIKLAKRWFPRSLLIDINEGHLNLAEAVLFMHEGGPLDTPGIIEQMGMFTDVSPRLAEFSLNYSMVEDSRFDEVGPTGRVLWYLTNSEPEAVQQMPDLLAYEPVEFNPADIPDEMLDILTTIADEYALTEPGSGIPQSVTVTFNYPHWRCGTLPLSAQLLRLFPTATQSPRVRFTMIDDETEQEYPAWVVRPHHYVFGLADWIAEKDIVVGSYVTVHRMDQSGNVRISVETRNPRKEWVPTAIITESAKLRFDNRQRPIATEFDDLMVVDVPDPDALDTLGRTMQRQGETLGDILFVVMRELAPIYPQGNIHAKTLYSAVNLVRRMPPGPIFALLARDPQFDYVGGPYWRLAESGG